MHVALAVRVLDLGPDGCQVGGDPFLFGRRRPRCQRLGHDRIKVVLHDAPFMMLRCNHRTAPGTLQAKLVGVYPDAEQKRFSCTMARRRLEWGMGKKDSAAATKYAIQLAGGASALARKLGLNSPAVVYQWSVTRVPAEWCPRLEELTGVRCEDLRPDVKWSVLRARAKP